LDYPELLEDFLKALIAKTPSIDSFVYHQLFELYLQQRRKLTSPESPTLVRTGSWSESKKKCEEKVETLIGDARGMYENNYLMMLLQMYEFPEGVAHLSQILRISQELLNHFYSKGDWDAIIGLCKEFGRREPDIWVQTLKYLAKLDDPRTAGYLTTILSDLSRLETLPVPPLVILSMLRKNRHITFEVVKAFFAGYIKKAIDSRVADSAALDKNLERSSLM
jgi:hypothetical protein